jgi:hypothetical protein
MNLEMRALAGILIITSGSFLAWLAWGRESFAGFAERPVIRLAQSAKPNSHEKIEVIGLHPGDLAKLKNANMSDSEWAALLAVHTDAGALEDAPAMLGSYESDSNAIRFTPRFPLVAGLNYQVRFNLALFKEKSGHQSDATSPTVIESTITFPKNPTQATKVAQIYPSADALPANQLKLYFYFSAPMSVGEAYDHIRLLNEAGRDVPLAFLRIDQELWDESRQRFTLLFDPGRVKRGLRSNLEDGAPLEAGKRYRLLIDRNWRDGEGNLLAADFEKAFSVVAPDRKSPSPQSWRIVAPIAGTTDPLMLTFDEPLDFALIYKMIEVLEAGGRPIIGRLEITGGEKQWRFTPSVPWQPGEYQIRPDSRLEDRAGNNLRRLYDVDLQAAATGPKLSTLRFAVSSKTNQP